MTNAEMLLELITPTMNTLAIMMVCNTFSENKIIENVNSNNRVYYFIMTDYSVLTANYDIKLKEFIELSADKGKNMK